MLLSPPSSLTLPDTNHFQARFAQIRSKIIQTPSILLNDEPLPPPIQEKEGTELFKEKLMDIFVKRNRTEDETRFLYAVIKDYAFFHRFRTDDSEIESEAALYICQNLRYQLFPAGSHIFKQGDLSNGKMYLVYSGRLRVETQQIDPIVMENLKEKQNETKKKLQRLGTKGDLEDEEAARNHVIHEMKRSFTRTQSKCTAEDMRSSFKSKKSKSIDPDGSNFSRSPNQSGARTPKITLSPAKRKSPTNKSENSLTNLDKLIESIQNTAIGSKEITSLAELIEEENHTINHKLHEAEAILKVFEFPKNEERKNDEKKVTFGGTLASLKFLNKMKTARKKAKQITSDMRNIVDIIQPGGFFGEKALTSNNPRSATITALTDCELLSLTKEEFEIVKIWFDKKKNKVIQFIQGTFPRLEVSSATILENFYYLIEERHYKLGNVVIKEGDYGDVFYLIFDGQCNLIKRVSMDETKHFKFPLSEASELVRSSKRIAEDLTISTLGISSFFGEEIIFRKSMTYDYTIKVASKSATILCIQKHKFNNRFPRAVQRGLREYYHQKEDLRKQQMKSLLEKKYHVQDLEKNIQQLFHHDDYEDYFHENNNEIDGFSSRPYYSAFKSTNQGNAQFSKDIMERMHLTDHASKNKEEFIHKLKHEEQRIRAMREEFLPLVRCDLITGVETKSSEKKEKKKVTKKSKTPKNEQFKMNNTFNNFNNSKISKSKITEEKQNNTITNPQNITNNLSINLSSAVYQESPKPGTARKKLQQLVNPGVGEQTPRSDALLGQSPRNKFLKIPEPATPIAKNSFFGNFTPKSPNASPRKGPADFQQAVSFTETRKSKFLPPDDLRSLTPRTHIGSQKVISEENPYNLLHLQDPSNDPNKPIRSNDITKQVQTWSEVYENALKKLASEPKESQEEREKRINNYENFKIDLGSTIPIIENKYKVMKMKLEFQFANRERKPPPRGPLKEYKYDFLNKDLAEKFITDLSTARSQPDFGASPINSDRNQMMSNDTSGAGSACTNTTPRLFQNNSALSLVASYEKDLCMTKSLKDGYLKNRLKNTHQLRKRLLKPSPRTHYFYDEA